MSAPATKQEWIDSLVEGRRDRGGYTRFELEEYRRQLIEKYAGLSEEAWLEAAKAIHRTATTPRAARP